METTQFNSEKNQRLQELYEKTIKRCNSEAKNRFWGLAIAVILVGALVLGVLDVQLWQKLSCVTILAVLALFDWWKTKQIYSVMSQAGDVNELLRANEECKKKLIKLNKWMVIPVLVAWMIAHYKGRFDGSLFLFAGGPRR